MNTDISSIIKLLCTQANENKKEIIASIIFALVLFSITIGPKAILDMVQNMTQ